MKSAVIVLALAAAVPAHAESFFQIEAGIGASHAARAGDNIWYHAGESHSTPTNSPAGRVGIQMNIIDAQPRSLVPGLRAHLTYNYMGHYTWSARAGFDPNPQHTQGYNVATKTCFNNDCGEYRMFQSSGNVQALALTLEPYWNIGGGWTVGVEAGPALYRAAWSVDASAETSGVFGPAGSVEAFHRSPRIQFGWMVGASVSKGPFSLRYNYLKMGIDGSNSGTSSVAGKNQWVPAGVKGIHMMTLNYTF